MLYSTYKPGQNSDDFDMSRYGYIIEPDGTIVSLHQLQVHGQIAYERNTSVKEYYDSLDEDRKNRTMSAAEVYATDELGHVRISIAPYIFQWSIGNSWSLPLTANQKESLKWLFDVCGVEDEIWTNTGEMMASDYLRSVL